MKGLQFMGHCKPVEYMQIISRVSPPKSKEIYSKVWYPLVEPRMDYFVIKEKHKLVKYVMHAKHSKIDKKGDKLQEVLGEEFDETWALAKKALGI